jgi:3-hydroxyacyl-[acyl-carrier protein] dehydratase/trans-2-decenoyl-[acyl-carrier protein] isomerase
VDATGSITPDTRSVRYDVAMRLVRHGKLVLGIADGGALADGVCVFTAKDMRVSLTNAVD